MTDLSTFMQCTTGIIIALEVIRFIKWFCNQHINDIETENELLHKENDDLQQKLRQLDCGDENA